MGDEELETLTGIRTALRDGEITIDEASPPLNFTEEGKVTDKKIKSESGSEPVTTGFENAPPDPSHDVGNPFTYNSQIEPLEEYLRAKCVQSVRVIGSFWR